MASSFWPANTLSWGRCYYPTIGVFSLRFSENIFYIIGGVKLLAALALLLGLKFKQTVRPAATIIAILMIGAIAMHFKIADPLVKSLPAITMLGMSLGILSLYKKHKLYIFIA